jgi:hypothetical protein
VCRQLSGGLAGTWPTANPYSLFPHLINIPYRTRLKVFYASHRNAYGKTLGDTLSSAQVVLSYEHALIFEAPFEISNLNLRPVPNLMCPGSICRLKCLKNILAILYIA